MWPFRRNSAHAIRSSEAYWLMRNGIGDARGPLTESVECDIAVIGAGITGALVTDSLLDLKASVVVLDQREPGQGSTCASTALLQYEIDNHLLDLREKLGTERAVLAYRACVESFGLLEARYPELLPLADYDRRESLYLASNERAVPQLQAELAARRAIGIAAQWLEADELQRRFDCRSPGAILSALGAQIDPLRLTRVIFAGCERHGARFLRARKCTRLPRLARDSPSPWKVARRSRPRTCWYAPAMNRSISSTCR